MTLDTLSQRALLLLALMHLSQGTLYGATRMQKIALLTSKQITKLEPDLTVFDDWVPDDFGGRSTQVYVTIDELIDHGLLSERLTTIEDKKLKVYTLTDQGYEEVKKIPSKLGKTWDSLSSVASRYVVAKTSDLLMLSYKLFPELAINSKIKPEVNKQFVKKLSPLSPLYDEDVGPLPSTSPKFKKRKEDLRILAEDEQFFKRREFEMQKLPDIEARKKMAQLIGLKELPKLDPYAIYRLDGILKSTLPKDKKIDSVELVRSVRGD
jgi:hypothetical protein